MKFLASLIDSKDFRSTLIAAAGLGLGVVASQMATGDVPDWKAVFASAGAVAANRIHMAVRPLLDRLSDWLKDKAYQGDVD